MGIELAPFHRRLEKRLKKQSSALAELYDRTCTVCGTQADVAGKCRVCGRQLIKIERDPVPEGVLRPIDPEKAELQKAFYERYNRERAEREHAAAEVRKSEVRRLRGESLPGDPPTRDWAAVLAAQGVIRRW